MTETKKPRRSMTAVRRYQVVRDAALEAAKAGDTKVDMSIGELLSWLKDAAIEEALGR